MNFKMFLPVRHTLLVEYTMTIFSVALSRMLLCSSVTEDFIRGNLLFQVFQYLKVIFFEGEEYKYVMPFLIFFCLYNFFFFLI